MKKLLYSIVVLILLGLTACSTPPTPTATNIPSTPAPTDTLTAVPTPTATSTPFPPATLKVNWKSCQSQEISLGQSLFLTHLPDQDIGNVFKTANTAQYFIDHVVVTIKIDQADPIVLKDPTLWSGPTPKALGTAGTYYFTDLNWPFPVLDVGQHQIEVDLKEPLLQFADKLCNNLTVVKP